MKSLVIIIVLLLPLIVWGQNFPQNSIQILGPKYLGDVDVSYNYKLKTTVTKVKLLFNKGEFNHTNDFTPLYLNQSTMDFTIVDENAIFSFVASEQAFYLNQIITDNKELLPAGSKLAPIRVTQDDDNIYLSWIVDDKELEITLWSENLKESFERDAIEVQQKKD